MRGKLIYALFILAIGVGVSGTVFWIMDGYLWFGVPSGAELASELGPELWIDSPAEGDGVPTGQAVSIRWRAFQPVNIASFDVMVNGEKVATVKNASEDLPFSKEQFYWYPPDTAPYTIDVIALDRRAQLVRTATVNVTARTPRALFGDAEMDHTSKHPMYTQVVPAFPVGDTEVCRNVTLYWTQDWRGDDYSMRIWSTDHPGVGFSVYNTPTPFFSVVLQPNATYQWTVWSKVPVPVHEHSRVIETFRTNDDAYCPNWKNASVRAANNATEPTGQSALQNARVAQLDGHSSQPGIVTGLVIGGILAMVAIALVVNKKLHTTTIFSVLGYVFLVQTAHHAEHVAQMFQIYVLGLRPADAHGLLGSTFDFEWVHFTYNFGLELALIALWLVFRRTLTEGTHRKGMQVLTSLVFFQGYHAFEHVFRIFQYLFDPLYSLGLQPPPGILPVVTGVPSFAIHFWLNMMVWMVLALALWYLRPPGLLPSAIDALSGVGGSGPLPGLWSVFVSRAHAIQGIRPQHGADPASKPVSSPPPASRPAPAPLPRREPVSAGRPAAVGLRMEDNAHEIATVNELNRIHERLDLSTVLFLFWGLFWILNGAAKFLTGNTILNTNGWPMSVGLLTLPFYVLAVVQLLLGTMFAFLCVRKFLAIRDEEQPLFGTRALPHLAFKVSALVFTLFIVGDIVFGDTGGLWQHSLYFAVVLDSYYLYTQHVRQRTRRGADLGNL